MSNRFAFPMSIWKRVVYVKSLCVSDVYLESRDLSQPVQIIDYVVFDVEDPVVDAVGYEVEEYWLILHLDKVEEEILVFFEEGSGCVVDGDVLAVKLPNLFIDYFMDFLANVD